MFDYVKLYPIYARIVRASIRKAFNIQSNNENTGKCNTCNKITQAYGEQIVVKTEIRAFCK